MINNITINNEYEKKYLDILKKITLEVFDIKGCKIFLFGSRAKGKYRRDSDYDIGIMNIDNKNFVMKKMELEEKVEESIIPHSVDIVNIDDVSEVFKKNAFKKRLMWKI